MQLKNYILQSEVPLDRTPFTSKSVCLVIRFLDCHNVKHNPEVPRYHED